MDPFPTRPPRLRADVAHALREPLQLTAFNARGPREALALLPGLHVKELELMAVAGEPLYLAALGRDHTRIVPVAAPPREEFDRQQIVSLVNSAAQPDGLAESQVIQHYDAYYLDRQRRKPLPVILARVNDPERTRYYIDPKTARVVGSYGSGSWMNRWLYHGLHSLDFPWLYNYRPLWDIVVIAFMLGGTALGVTSLVLAWRVLGSHLPAR